MKDYKNIFSKFICNCKKIQLLTYYILIFAAYKCSKLDFPSKKLMQEYVLEQKWKVGLCGNRMK